eukprot:CAMPEP_0181505040 /NCGR_PEP_ID=MMETSP1110-20121109/57843_1 /TAXON_ID=174948 /ORGANISM="Symbiodinium sp., Strain CCMP421" /LENGTH=61 /DNA_ID=CAMNT_0023633993 /DNA_START=165 /DNA_END=350 /DNA_ORIENTATION=-
MSNQIDQLGRMECIIPFWAAHLQHPSCMYQGESRIDTAEFSKMGICDSQQAVQVATFSCVG